VWAGCVCGDAVLAQTISHEVGHILNLRHDGTISPPSEYLFGLPSTLPSSRRWNAIMGGAGKSLGRDRVSFSRVYEPFKILFSKLCSLSFTDLYMHMQPHRNTHSHANTHARTSQSNKQLNTRLFSSKSLLCALQPFRVLAANRQIQCTPSLHTHNHTQPWWGWTSGRAGSTLPQTTRRTTSRVSAAWSGRARTLPTRPPAARTSSYHTVT
jgi:hypothetical protein